MNELPAESQAAIDEILNRPDPDLVGILLTGSAGRGVATERSDVDVWTFYDRDIPFSAHRSRYLDEVRAPIDGMPVPGAFGTDDWYQRWAFAWPNILRDTPDRKVEKLALRRATVTEDEQRAIIPGRLGGYLNFVYRALKSHDDGRILERDLDATESVSWLLDAVFPLFGRVRPYNKYLVWELREHPLPVPEWSAEMFGPQLAAMVAGDVATIRAVFAVLERECLAYDAARGITLLAEEFDWEDAIAILRRHD